MIKTTKFLLTAMLLSAAMMLKAGIASAQDNISGHVIDNEGYPVIGAAVIIDGTSTGTTTGIDGEFTLDMAEGTAITVSCIGYTDVRTTFTPGMTITMQVESTLLDDVVVVAYGVQKKETLTGAISVVKDEMLEEKGALSSPLQAMQGQIPGVIITRSSSAPGDESWGMSLRGAVSTNSSEPLVIIDGVAYESLNDMRLLNPSDIESMSFLKDGAAAIYGSRAAGVYVMNRTEVDVFPDLNAPTVVVMTEAGGMAAEEMAVGRVAVKWRQKKEVGAPGRPKENGGRAYALPPFVMRGYVLLRLPDQKTMTGRT